MIIKDLLHSKPPKPLECPTNGFSPPKPLIKPNGQPEGKSGLNQILAPNSGYLGNHLSDVCGSPSDSLDQTQLNAVKREWRDELKAKVKKGIIRYLNPSEPTFQEIIEIEKEVRRNLYE